jgi:hypothetical protein
MKSILNIKVKVTGLIASEVNLRRKIENGYLTNALELVFTLPGFGPTPLEDDFNVEICDTSLPKEEYQWNEMTVGELKKALRSGQFVKKKLLTP